MKIRIFFLALILSTSAFADDSVCIYYLPACKAEYARYNDGAKAITQDVTAKKITVQEGGKRIVALAQALYPEDGLILMIAAQQQVIADLSGKITPAQQKALEESAAKVFKRSLDERFVLFDAMSQVSDQQQKAVVQAQQNAAAQAYAQANQAQDVRSTIATSYFLNRVGQAFATSWGQSLLPTPQICTYYGGTSYCQ